MIPRNPINCACSDKEIIGQVEQPTEDYWAIRHRFSRYKPMAVSGNADTTPHRGVRKCVMTPEMWRDNGAVMKCDGRLYIMTYFLT